MKKEEKTEITRKKIFEAAMTEFGTRGYGEGSLNNICKTGINKGLIYHNYKDKDELYLLCVKKSCEEFLAYVTKNHARDGFVQYMKVRKSFFEEHEREAFLFLEARTSPPQHLFAQIQEIFREIDAFNVGIFEKELSKVELRSNVSKDEALHYFLEIQKIYNLTFANELKYKMAPDEQVKLHEMNIHKLFDFMLYGIAKGGNEK